MIRIFGRFLLPLVVVLAAMAYFCLPYAEHLADQWFKHDLELRSQFVFNSIQDELNDALAAGNRNRVQQLFQHLTQDKYLLAVGYCDPQGELTYHHGGFPTDFSCQKDYTWVNDFPFPWTDNNNAVLITQFLLGGEGEEQGKLVILNDLQFLKHRHNDARNALFVFLLLICLGAAVVTELVAYLTLRSWLRAVRSLLQKESGGKISDKKIPQELKPLVLDLYRLMRRRSQNRQTSHPTRPVWTADSLRQFLKSDLPGEDVIAVSNREPYVHHDKDGLVVLQTPVGGLVSALEPIMRACKGTWIAHGSGSADRTAVDSHDRLGVPPDSPTYTLRRIWLSDEEEAGYYDGFANEGLWPLCHLVFTRPIFREEDWNYYVAVNRKFADAVVAEARTKSPIVLVQDYHFALLPVMIHERLPRAIVATFWHIPWPNVEAFSICPWREDILKGLLGSDILGFHTQFHCNNFFEAVDRFLECRIDRERKTVTKNEHVSLVRPYPISIEWLPSVIATLPPVAACRANVLQRLNLPADIKLGVGVERFDYTKGIIDRFQAVARFFHYHPAWIGKLTFVQVAAPTRSKIPRYKEVQIETTQMAETINTELGRGAWKPIILITESYDQAQVFELFRASDFCIVSSLHDGMNLVAKEFVAAREDERGVLILSTFAGASEELLQALIVNPHDAKGMADAIHRAVHMKPTEQEQRMRLLRGVVRDHNIFWWAGQILLDVTRILKSNVIALPAKFTDRRNRALPSGRSIQSVLSKLFSRG